MKLLLLITIFLNTLLVAQELRIKSNSFKADQNNGISVFTGDVNIIRNNDELNASEVTIFTDKQNQPTKFIAFGNVSFFIVTKQGAKYSGLANKVIYMPATKEYHFFENVHLKQIDEKKEILGDEVVLKTADGEAYAKGMEKEPVMMIFDIVEEKE